MQKQIASMLGNMCQLIHTHSISTCSLVKNDRRGYGCYLLYVVIYCIEARHARFGTSVNYSKTSHCEHLT